MKKIFITLAIVVASLLFISIFKDFIIKAVVTSSASGITGAPVHIDGLLTNIFNSTVNITGFKMYNPSGFPEGLLVSCPKIKIVFDLASLFKHKPHFILVDVQLKEMVLTKNKEGKLNVDSLKIVHPPKSSVPAPLQIDLLNLSIGKIVYEDYTIANKAPSVKVYDINRHQSYKSIPSAQQLALLVLSQPMKAAAIKDAEIYGVAIVAGVAMLPVAVVATLISKDDVQQSINASFDHVYKISLEVVNRMGTITKYDVSNGMIKADINGSTVALMLKKGSSDKTEITISARKFMLPELDVAGGVLYQILDKLN